MPHSKTFKLPMTPSKRSTTSEAAAPAPQSGITLSSNTLTLILAGLAFVMLTQNKGCDLGKLVPSPAPTPSVNSIVPSAAALSACAPIKSAVASADASKRARLSRAFMDLAYTINATNDRVKSTGRLSDLIQDFTDVVAETEPDLRGVMPSTTNFAFSTARDSMFLNLPGTGVDKPITKAQAADFVAAISKSFE